MKRIELDKGTATVIENYTPETKKALNKMCTLLVEAVQTEKLSISKFRGYDIELKDDQFYFCDTGEPTIDTWENRPCGYCGKHNTPKGHDACLGELPGVINACCGHGERNVSYIQFENGFRIEGFKVDHSNI
tara:strand:+ start:1147 stop:1542 length:396 start_codon:yes stop_codon:yes gene_type:complete